MSIRLKRRYEELETATIDVIDKYGEVFEFEGATWQMVVYRPDSDTIKNLLTRQADEASRWRARQPASKRDGALPSEMNRRHSREICAAAHKAWINAAIETDGPVDFQSDDFAEFLEAEPWYFIQWQKAWTDLTNFRKPMETGPKPTSSAGVSDKSD